MSTGFGDYLASVLKTHGLKQEALVQWLLDHQRPPARFKTTFALKEHLRTSRQKGDTALHYPLLPDIASYLEDRGGDLAAARLRHIYLQQAYDSEREHRLHGTREPYSEIIESLIFPGVDHRLNDLHAEAWNKALRAGDRDILRESLQFYFQYASSPVHSIVRQTIALTLARRSITQAEYQHAFLLSESYIRAWRRMFPAVRAGASRYTLKKKDVLDYMNMLITRSTAVSFIFYNAPAIACRPLFEEALRELHRMEPLLNLVSNTSFQQIKARLYTERARMLTRAILSTPLTGEPAHILHRTSLLRSLARTASKLQHLAESQLASPIASSGELSLLVDTWIRCIALLLVGLHNSDCGNHNYTKEFSLKLLKGADPSSVLDSLDKLLTNCQQGSPINQDPLTRYRIAYSRALLAICSHNIEPTPERSSKLIELLMATANSVPVTTHRHIHFGIDQLLYYSLLSRRPYNCTSSCEIPSESLRSGYDLLLNHKYVTQYDALFTVDPEDSAHFDCLYQANYFRRRGQLFDEPFYSYELP